MIAYLSKQDIILPLLDDTGADMLSIRSGPTSISGHGRRDTKCKQYERHDWWARPVKWSRGPSETCNSIPSWHKPYSADDSYRIPGAYMHGITPERVSGLWMRNFLFTATALDGLSLLTIANVKSGITSNIPLCN